MWHIVQPAPRQISPLCANFHLAAIGAVACLNRFQAVVSLLSQNQTIIPILLQIAQNRPQSRNKTQNNNNSINASFFDKKTLSARRCVL